MPRLTFHRALLLLCLAPACAGGEADLRRPNLPGAPGIHVEESSSSSGDESTGHGSSSGGSSTGGAPADVSSSGGGDDASTGAALVDETTGDVTGEGSTSGASSTGDVEGTSTGDVSSSSGGESSTGEPPEPPAVCGDGLCEPSERAPCWATPKEAWCFIDCYQAPECESDCPCTAAVNAIKNFCYGDPPVDCAATKPGGYCDPNGDGKTDDADDVQGFYAWHAKCG